MNKLLTVAAGAALMFSSVAFGASTGPRDVIEVAVSANQKVTVKLSGAVVDPAGCGQNVYVIDGNEPARKDMLAQLLTAKALGAQVTLAINDNVCANGGRSARISVVTLE